MPRYIYKCQNCKEGFQAVHSIKEKLRDCEKCQTKDTLQRVPSMSSILVKKQVAEKRQVGDHVKEHIEDAREGLKDEKKELSNQVYKDG